MSLFPSSISSSFISDAQRCSNLRFKNDVLKFILLANNVHNTEHVFLELFLVTP